MTACESKKAPCTKLLTIALAGCLALSAPASRADLFSGTYEGTLTSQDGEDVSTGPARAVIAQTGPLLTIQLFHFSEGNQTFIAVHTFEAEASGSSFALDVSPFVRVTGTVAGGSLQIVRTVQGTPLLVNTYSLTCIADCPEPDPGPEPEPDPEPAPCPDAPPPLEWAGENAGEFSDAENWDEERVPGPDDSVLLDAFSVDAGQTLTIDIIENAVNDHLEVMDAEVVLTSSAALPTDYLLLGICNTALSVAGGSAKADLVIKGSLAVDADRVLALGTDPTDPMKRGTLWVTETGELTADTVSILDGSGAVRDAALLRVRDVALAGRSFLFVGGTSAELEMAGTGAALELKPGGSVTVAEDSQILVTSGAVATLPGTVLIDVEGEPPGFVVRRPDTRCDADSVSISNGRLEISDQAQASFDKLAVGEKADGAESTADATAVVDKARLECSDLEVGSNGIGRMEINGGAAAVDVAFLGLEPNSDGSVAVGVGGELSASDLIVGAFGAGRLDIAGGGSVDAETLALGHFREGSDAGTGTLMVREPASSLSVSGELKIGVEGEGVLLLSDRASFAVQGPLTIGETAGGEGLVSVTDSARSVAFSGPTVVGESGAGTMTIAARGRVESNQVASIGAGEGSLGTVTVEGQDAANRSEWVTNDTLNVGLSGKGDLLIRDSGRVSSRDAILGVTELGSGLVEITTGGVWAVNGDVRVGGDGVGILITDATAILQANLVGVSSLSTLNGQLIHIGGAAAPQGVNLGGAPKPRNAAREMGDAADLAPGIYTRTLLIEGGATVQAQGVSLEEGGVLGGTGKLDLSIENRGRLRPGDDCAGGTLTIDAGYAQAPGGILEITIAGARAGSLAVDGAATLGGTLDVRLVQSDVSPIGRTFRILTAAAVSGSFDEVRSAGQVRIDYGPDSVDLTLLAAEEGHFAPCSDLASAGSAGALPNAAAAPCGAGLCGAGVLPVLPLLMLGLAQWKRQLLRRA